MRSPRRATKPEGNYAGRRGAWPKRPRYYRSIRPLTLRIDSMAPQIRAGFVRLKELYPEARFPNVYFVIGRYNSGGTSSGQGMLIGADMQCRAPGVDESELTLWARNNLGSFAGLPSLVAHEPIHCLQKGGNDPSLLRGAINEGMADFLAELATGRNPNGRLQQYGLPHENKSGVTSPRKWPAPTGTTGLPTAARKPPTSPPTWATS